MSFVKYEHFGKEVWCRQELKGKHREHCLCFSCKKLNIEDREKNCYIANIIYALDCGLNLVTPIFECPEFEENGL